MEDINRLILALLEIPGVGAKTVSTLMAELGDEFYKLSDYEELVGMKITKSSFPTKQIQKEELTMKVWQSYLEKGQDKIQKAKQLNIKLINPYIDEYPNLLKKLPNHPALIYAKGDLSLLNDDKIVAVIGTRKPSPFGGKMCQRVSQYLAEVGFTIVSGLALGCDSIAHQTAVDISGKTIAVLAHGLNHPIYPAKNRPLASKILESGGLLISTYPIEQKPYKSSFVERDMWQMGLSLGVFVAETSLGGGSNHAARAALSQGRPLAVLDHWAYEPLKNILTPQIEGNRYYLESEEVYPIFQEESLELFINAMKSYIP